MFWAPPIVQDQYLKNFCAKKTFVYSNNLTTYFRILGNINCKIKLQIECINSSSPFLSYRDKPCDITNHTFELKTRISIRIRYSIEAVRLKNMICLIIFSRIVMIHFEVILLVKMIKIFVYKDTFGDWIIIGLKNIERL